MTDQADALAGKLRDGYETCWKKWACVDIPTQLFAEFAAMATAHFAEEIAKVAEATLARVRAGLTRERIVLTLMAQCSWRTIYIGHAVEVSEINRNAILNMADALLALLAPEGKG